MKLPGRAIILAAAIALPVAGEASAESWTARGNEPGWRVEVSEESIAFTPMEGATVTVSPVPEPTRANEVAVYAASAGGTPFVLVAVDKICTDTMSGMPFPKTVAVAVGEASYVGCGGEPVSLLLGERKVVSIGGEPVIANSEATIAFEPDGSIHGNGSCNRFFGKYALTGEGLTISPGGASMMACDEPAMQQEQRFLAALGTVRGFEMASDGQLHLVGDDGQAVVTAR